MAAPCEAAAPHWCVSGWMRGQKQSALGGRDPKCINHVYHVPLENREPKVASIPGSPEKDPPEDPKIKDDFSFVRHFRLVSFSCLLGAALNLMIHHFEGRLL